jgi:hypothetical protein
MRPTQSTDSNKRYRIVISRLTSPVCNLTQKEKKELVHEGLLEELCGSEEGRALVDQIRNEGLNIYTSETAFPIIPGKIGLGFFDSTTYSRTGSANIYVNRSLDTIAEVRSTGYRGSGREFQSLILRHEVAEYNIFKASPGEPTWIRDAHARVVTDDFARQVNFQPWFPGMDLNDHLDANKPTPRNPDGYGRTEKASDYHKMIADRILIEGWDCSRVQSSKN